MPVFDISWPNWQADCHIWQFFPVSDGAHLQTTTPTTTTKTPSTFNGKISGV